MLLLLVRLLLLLMTVKMNSVDKTVIWR